MALTGETRTLHRGRGPGPAETGTPADAQPTEQWEGEPGLVLGRYRLGTRLGAGGFGAVHEALDELLERRVAVKVIPADGSASDRARREARAAARLDHPGIVALFDAGEEPGSRYLVSELVEGRTLAQLETAEELTDRDVLRIGLALCDALAHAHERGVVHRDVKPQNVLVPDRPGTWRAAAKLTDFGVATLAGDDPLTLTGDVVGTLAYMAPEQAAGRRVDERADLYALALVVYEALAGVNPVRAASPAATARKVGTVLPPLHRRRKDLPADLCAAIDRALRPEAGQRGTLEELADAFEDALLEIADDGGTILRHPLERRTALPRGAGRALSALATGALAAAAGALASPAAPVPPWAVGLAVGFAVALLPRIGWVLTAAGVVAVLLGAGAVAGSAPALPGIALLVALATVPVPFLLRRRPSAWSAPAIAPLLGVVGLAGAFPGLAGRLERWTERAALGALGAWWLTIAEPLAGRTLYLGAPTGVPEPEVFEGALYMTLGDVVEPILMSGTAGLTVVWALWAAALPLVVRARSTALRMVTATMWAGALAAATEAFAGLLGTPAPRGLAAGAVAAGIAAVAADRGYLGHGDSEADPDTAGD